MPSYRIMIVIGSTRPGRAGSVIADWVVSRIQERSRFVVDVADLMQVALPLWDEPYEPRLRRYTKQHTQRWSQRVDRADGYVFVVPEYNHSLNAATKNALDYLYQEWVGKPLCIVTYGGRSGGSRAAEHLAQVGLALQMRPLRTRVSVPNVVQLVRGGSGMLDASAGDLLTEALDELLASL